MVGVILTEAAACRAIDLMQRIIILKQLAETNDSKTDLDAVVAKYISTSTELLLHFGWHIPSKSTMLGVYDKDLLLRFGWDTWPISNMLGVNDADPTSMPSALAEVHAKFTAKVFAVCDIISVIMKHIQDEEQNSKNREVIAFMGYIFTHIFCQSFFLTTHVFSWQVLLDIFNTVEQSSLSKFNTTIVALNHVRSADAQLPQITDYAV